MKQAVLLLAHGTPDSAEQVPAYLQHVTSGRQLLAEVVVEIQHRYALVGHSPLTEITRAQADTLQRKIKVPVHVGMRNWHPFIADTIAKMRADDITHALVICLAPQNSRTSVGMYKKAVQAAAHDKLQCAFVESWHAQPELIEAFAAKLRAVRTRQQPVIFTAHSVPTRTIDEGDPYDQQARETAQLVAKRAGLSQKDWRFAFQSQGQSGGPWIGPTVEATIDALASEGNNEVVVQPIGFLCDHVEVLYDIDIAFKHYARSRGIELTRTESLNDSPQLTEALAAIVHAHLPQPTTA
jgi:protoporphyrin/coproporphyrin ferrochelatase